MAEGKGLYTLKPAASGKQTSSREDYSIYLDLATGRRNCVTTEAAAYLAKVVTSTIISY
jgi:hypothetical protein